MFWSLGSFGDLSKDAVEAWRMQSSILREPKASEDMTPRSLLVARAWGLKYIG